MFPKCFALYGDIKRKQLRRYYQFINAHLDFQTLKRNLSLRFKKIYRLDTLRAFLATV